MNEIQRIQEAHRDILIAIELHGYVFVSEPRTRGGATLLDFHRFSDGDEVQVAEGELLFWLADLDAAKVARERITTVKPRRKRAATARQERMALDESDDTIEDFRRIQDEIRAAMGDE